MDHRYQAWLTQVHRSDDIGWQFWAHYKRQSSGFGTQGSMPLSMMLAKDWQSLFQQHPLQEVLWYDISGRWALILHAHYIRSVAKNQMAFVSALSESTLFSSRQWTVEPIWSRLSYVYREMIIISRSFIEQCKQRLFHKVVSDKTLMWYVLQWWPKYGRMSLSYQAGLGILLFFTILSGVIGLYLWFVHQSHALNPKLWNHMVEATLSIGLVVLVCWLIYASFLIKHVCNGQKMLNDVLQRTKTESPVPSLDLDDESLPFAQVQQQGPAPQQCVLHSLHDAQSGHDFLAQKGMHRFVRW